MERLRVASLQYFIRPVSSFDQFRDQVVALVETAVDYECRLMVFPEYFTIQLLTLGNVRRPMPEQVRGLAAQVPAFVDLMAGLARKHKTTILDSRVSGTVAPLYDSRNTASIVTELEEVTL